MSYDDLCKLVNDAYRDNPDIRIRTLANDLDISFDVVWDCQMMSGGFGWVWMLSILASLWFVISALFNVWGSEIGSISWKQGCLKKGG